MSEASINGAIIVGFIVIMAVGLVFAYFYGVHRARSRGASDADLQKAFAKTRSKLGLIVGLILLVTLVLLGGVWIHLNRLT